MPFKKGMIPYNKGKKRGEWRNTQKWKKICPFCKKEIITKRNSQIYCNINCYSKSEKIKLLAKNSEMIKNNSIKKYHQGYKHSKATKERILNHPKRYSFPKGRENPGFNKSPETIRKIKEKRLYQKILKKDTKPEQVIQKLLYDLKIEFIKHKPIIDIIHKYQCDIFIKPNIIIECDGDYFHNYPAGRVIDKVRNKELSERGYVVLRFWKCEIKNNLDYCKNEILGGTK